MKRNMRNSFSHAPTPATALCPLDKVEQQVELESVVESQIIASNVDADIRNRRIKFLLSFSYN